MLEGRTAAVVEVLDIDLEAVRRIAAVAGVLRTVQVAVLHTVPVEVARHTGPEEVLLAAHIDLAVVRHTALGAEAAGPIAVAEVELHIDLG